MNNRDNMSEIKITIKKRINLYEKDNDNKYNWLDIEYDNISENFQIKFIYENNLFLIKNYLPNKTLPYNFNLLETNVLYNVKKCNDDNDDEDIVNFTNFYIERLNEAKDSFNSNVIIEIKINDIIITKKVLIHYNPLSKYNELVSNDEIQYNNPLDINDFSINFSNLSINDLILPGTIISYLTHNLLGYESISFSIINKYLDIINNNNILMLVAKERINNLINDYLDFTLNIIIRQNNTLNCFTKNFKLKIIKQYVPLIKLDQNHGGYVNEPCWLTFHCTNIIPINIDLYKKEDDKYILIEKDY